MELRGPRDAVIGGGFSDGVPGGLSTPHARPGCLTSAGVLVLSGKCQMPQLPLGPGGGRDLAPATNPQSPLPAPPAWGHCRTRVQSP